MVEDGDDGEDGAGEKEEAGWGMGFSDGEIITGEMSLQDDHCYNDACSANLALFQSAVFK